jgi:hypothetical protein
MAVDEVTVAGSAGDNGVEEREPGKENSRR